jgi:hypothetical protein
MHYFTQVNINLDGGNMRTPFTKGKGQGRERKTQRGNAATKDEKTNFTTKVTKSTKLRSLKISMSETFVAFVCFVVRKYF